MVAEFLLVEVEQSVPMLVLLGRHGNENIRGSRIVVAQALGNVVVDTAIFLFGADGEGENFAF